MRTTAPTEGIPAVEDLPNANLRRKLSAAIEQYVETRTLFQDAKAILSAIMGASQLSTVQHGDLRAYWRQETRKSTKCADLLDAGVPPETVAACASSANRTKLLRCGVDPVTIEEATTETEFTKCYVETTEKG